MAITGVSKEASVDGPQSPKTVCIIGGGVAGLVSAKVLKRDGFEVTVYEKEATIGGVWAKSRAYPGLRSNNPKEAYAFSDFDYPVSADDFPTAGQIRSYLESYAEYFGLKPHIRLNTEVLSVSRRNRGSNDMQPGFFVEVCPAGKAEEATTREFRFLVICNGVFSEPQIPDIEGMEHFEGTILHSSLLTGEEIVKGKKVVVVGAGKSALDCAKFAAQQAGSTTLVFRKPHWMIPRYFGRTRVDYLLFNRFSENIFPAYHKASKSERVIRAAVSPLLLLWRTVVGKVVKRKSGMPDEMVPDVPVTKGIENNGIGDEFYQILNEGLASTRRGRIASFNGGKKLQLDTGEQIEADVVIFATGWVQNISFLEQELKQEIRKSGFFQLYRHILPPRERQLGFVGYASSGNAPLTSEISAHWLSQYFRGELALPEEQEMNEEIARVRRWAKKVFSHRNDGYFIGAYVSSYLDELLTDMGLPTRRAESFFKEHFYPAWAMRYRKVEDERKDLQKTRSSNPQIATKQAILNQ